MGVEFPVEERPHCPGTAQCGVAGPRTAGSDFGTSGIEPRGVAGTLPAGKNQASGVLRGTPRGRLGDATGTQWDPPRVTPHSTAQYLRRPKEKKQKKQRANRMGVSALQQVPAVVQYEGYRAVQCIVLVWCCTCSVVQ